MLKSRVCDKNVSLSCEKPACVLDIPYGGFDLIKISLENFYYSEG